MFLDLNRAWTKPRDSNGGGGKIDEDAVRGYLADRSIQSLTEPHNPLWTFSLSFYGLPGVAEACIRCQEEAAADVNLILFLLWQAGSGTSHNAESIATIDRTVSAWRREVIQPLRELSRLLKGRGVDLFRDAIKSCELDAERLEQDALRVHAKPTGSEGSAEASRSSLTAYGTVLPSELPDAAVAVLVTTLRSMVET